LILGLGTDLCPASRWEHLLERFGEKGPRRILHEEEAAYLLGGNRQRLPERLAGRWALREAFGKALGVGLDGWSWKQLRFLNGRLWAEGDLAVELDRRGVEHLHASISHDGGVVFAVVILEGTKHHLD
jgi:holo-[acyl-carrier protein] synthase